MATINGLTAAAMRAIRDGAIVGASVDISGHLMLEKYDGTFLDAGAVIGPVGPVGPAGPVNILDELDDVDTTGLANKKLLQFNGTMWVPANPSIDDLGDVNAAGAGGGKALVHNGTEWVVGGVPLTTASVLSSAVALFESIASSAYGDLATIGPSVSATIGASGKALVIVSADLYNDTNVAPTFMNYAISGATTLVPQDAAALRTQSDELAASRISIVSGLNPGVNVFTSKYKALGGTGYFGFRSLTVIPL